MSAPSSSAVRIAEDGAMRAEAPGKVNLHFQVGPRRDDGYHAVASLYAAVDVLEAVELAVDPQLAPGTIECALQVVPGSLVAQQQAAGAFDPALVPLDERNLAVRAARAVLAQAPELSGGLRLRIDKAVPVAGGMGGGSADAAAALLAAAELVARETGQRIPRDRLLALAEKLGADVPFALTGGAAVGTGTGAQLRPVPVGRPWSGVLVADAGALSTPQVFATLDRLRAEGELPQRQEDRLAVPDELLRALADGHGHAGAAQMCNDLQDPALAMSPELRGRLEDLEAGGARALISGSGPTIIALPEPSQGSDGAEAARALAESLRGRGLCAVSCAIG